VYFITIWILRIINKKFHKNKSGCDLSRSVFLFIFLLNI
jgi:hypothetical protein